MSKWSRKIWDEVARPLLLRPKRVQFAALCTQGTGAETEVLLITSRDTGRWIIPKGWPIDGLDGPQAAAQEAWEEAGVREAKVNPDPVGYYTYGKVLKDGSVEPVLTNVYHLTVAKLSDDYPEADQRERHWVSPQVAAARVDEPELRDLLLEF